MNISRYNEKFFPHMITQLGTVTALVLIISGCVSTPTLTQVTNFGEASASLADNTGNGFELLNNTTVERKMFLVASDPEGKPNDSTYEGVLKDENKAIRLAAVSQLGLYGAGLKKLAQADVRKEVDTAAQELDGALNGLAKTLGKEAEVEPAIGIITVAINAIGQEIVDRKKRQAIKTVIEQADKYVQGVAELVSKEFKDLAPFVKLNIETQKLALNGEYDKLIKSNAGFGARVALMRRIRKLHVAAKTAEPFFIQVSEGALKVSIAHTALKKAVDDNFATNEALAAISNLIDASIRVKVLLAQIQQSTS